MKNNPLFCFTLHSNVSQEVAWEALQKSGVIPLYTIEEDGIIQLFGHAQVLPSSLPIVKLVERIEEPTIDWEAQWALFGSGFSDGMIHVDLSPFNPKLSTIRLKPGAGFGDYSHPTTRLTMKLMASFVPGCLVCDLGCGSGILSLAAVALGATHVDAIDIDPEALDHAKRNAELNLMTNISFYLPEEYRPARLPTVVIMNMLPAEQLLAWESLPALKETPEIIISGVLEEKMEVYLRQVSTYNWELVELSTEEGWCALRFRAGFRRTTRTSFT